MASAITESSLYASESQAPRAGDVTRLAANVAETCKLILYIGNRFTMRFYYIFTSTSYVTISTVYVVYLSGVALSIPICLGELGDVTRLAVKVLHNVEFGSV